MPPNLTPMHITFKLEKIEGREKVLKKPWCSRTGGWEKKQLTCIGANVKIVSGFSSETTQAKGEWSEIFKALRK